MKTEKEVDPQHDGWGDKCIESREALLRAARGLTRNDADAEDLANGVYITMREKAPDVSEVEKPTAYLCSTMRNNNFTKHKKENTSNMTSMEEPRGENQVVGDSIPARTIDILTQMQKDEEGRMMWGELDYLKGKERDLLRLHLEGKSNSEIAEMRGEEVGQVARDMNKIRTKFIKHCKEHLIDPQKLLAGERSWAVFNN